VQPRPLLAGDDSLDALGDASSGSGTTRGDPRRALLLHARDSSPDLWRRCLLASLDHEALEEQEALSAAAEIARESHGLEFKQLRQDGVILSSLRAALDEAVRTGEVRRARLRVFKLPPAGFDRRLMSARCRKVRI
jgi:hypothetical protein